MKDLAGSKLLASIKEDLTPQNPQEDVEIISIGIDVCLNIEELTSQLKVYQDKGFHTVKFISQHNNIQTINLIRHRSSEELEQYRIDRVRHPILRWFYDGHRRLNETLQSKEQSLINYREKVKNTKVVCPSMKECLDRKEKRILEYREAVRKIKEVIDNYPQYTYQELNELPDKLLPRYNTLE